MICGSKYKKSKSSQICSCLLVLSLCLLVLSPCLHAQPVLSLHAQFLEDVIFLHELFTKSVRSGSKYGKSENLELWMFGNPKIWIWESGTFLHKFSTLSMITDSKCPKLENCKICSRLLVLSLYLLVLSLCLHAQAVLSAPKS